MTDATHPVSVLGDMNVWGNLDARIDFQVWMLIYGGTLCCVKGMLLRTERRVLPRAGRQHWRLGRPWHPRQW